MSYVHDIIIIIIIIIGNGSGVSYPASHRGGAGPIADWPMWNMWRTKWP
jgi:hypothetical protein